MRLLQPAFACLLLAACFGCAADALGDGEPELIPCEVDVGEDGADAGVGDAGFCENPAFVDGDEDGGEEALPVVGADCLPLVSKTCGAANECGADPGCVAASLVNDFAPERCTAAFNDNRSYPACSLGSCVELVNKVCGTDDSCNPSPPCDPALILKARADDGDVSANASCGQALVDEVLFPRCG